MWQFIKYVMATMVGLFLFTIVGFFLVLGIVAVVSVSSLSNHEVSISENTILKIDLNQKIVERTAEDNPFEALGSLFNSEDKTIGLITLKKILTNAKADPNIKGIYLDANYPMAGWASLEEIRNDLISFKKSGKFIYAYGEYYTEKGYYLSSVADKIYLNPAGGMEWNGLSAEYTFFKGTLDKLGIKPEIFRVGDYKSAVEPFLRENMSEPSKEQTRVFLNGILDYTWVNIAQSRKISVTSLKNAADSLAIDTPQEALKRHFVTHVGYYDEFEADLRKTIKLSTEKKMEFIAFNKYAKAKDIEEEPDTENKVAVIVGSGEIRDGNGGNDNIDGEEFAAQIRKARNDKKIKAIVLRINSPGGSALASDLMWREVSLARQTKPVIASMSDVAASGGYYMAMAADTIVAQPTTITGSIGIFALLFNVAPFMKEKLGLTFDRVGTNAHADFPTGSREMTDFEKAKLQKMINTGYQSFTTKAAQGRKMPLEKLKSLAGGRVWTGSYAKANGLVDVLGGLNDAITLAAKAAKLKENDYKVRYYPETKSFVQELLDKASDQAEAHALQQQFGGLGVYIKQIKALQKMQGIQARLPFELEIK